MKDIKGWLMRGWRVSRVAEILDVPLAEVQAIAQDNKIEVAPEKPKRARAKALKPYPRTETRTCKYCKFYTPVEIFHGNCSQLDPSVYKDQTVNGSEPGCDDFVTKNGGSKHLTKEVQMIPD